MAKMFSHKQVWAAIDTIAERYGFSASGLAKKSGLDPTSFNPSKRNGPDGRPRWPTTESIANLLDAAGASVEEFADLLSGRKGQPPRRKQIPLLGLARAGKGGFFDDSGFPVGNGWDEIDVPGVTDNTAYALEITGDSMLPVYREGDTIIVRKCEDASNGDIVVALVDEEEATLKLLRRRGDSIALEAANPAYETRIFPPDRVKVQGRLVGLLRKY